MKVRFMGFVATILAAVLLGACNGENGAPAKETKGNLVVQEDVPQTLTYAWTFANCITNDVKDLGKYQTMVLAESISSGLLEQAEVWGGSVTNWRRGIVYADLAHAHLLKGASEEAISGFLEQAAEEALKTIDWRQVRIRMHIAQANALLGKGDELKAARDRFKTDNAVRGKAGAFHALALARSGDVEGAMKVLDVVGDESLYDVRQWHARGLVLLARDGQLPKDKQLEVLEHAEAACARVQGWRKHEIRMLVVEEWLRLGEQERAAEAMKEIHDAMVGLSLPAHLRTSVLGKIACMWAEFGNVERVVALYDVSAPLIETKDMQPFERPIPLAYFAEAFYKVGEKQRALGLFADAIDRTAAIGVGRVRAIAAVEVALAAVRSDADLQSLESSLDGVLATFGRNAN